MGGINKYELTQQEESANENLIEKNAFGHNCFSVFSRKFCPVSLTMGSPNICNYFSRQDLAWTSIITAFLLFLHCSPSFRYLPPPSLDQFRVARRCYLNVK